MLQPLFSSVRMLIECQSVAPLTIYMFYLFEKKNSNCFLILFFGCGDKSPYRHPERYQFPKERLLAYPDIVSVTVSSGLYSHRNTICCRLDFKVTLQLPLAMQQQKSCKVLGQMCNHRQTTFNAQMKKIARSNLYPPPHRRLLALGKADPLSDTHKTRDLSPVTLATFHQFPPRMVIDPFSKLNSGKNEGLREIFSRW